MKKIGNDEQDLTFIVSYKIDKEEQTIYMWHADGEVYLAPYTEENVRKLNLKMDKQARHSSIKPRTKWQERYSYFTSGVLGATMYQAYKYHTKSDIILFAIAFILKAENIISKDKYFKNKQLVEKYKYLLEHKDELNRFAETADYILKNGISKKATKELESKIDEGEIAFTFNNVEKYTIDDLVQMVKNIDTFYEDSEEAGLTLSVMERTRNKKKKF